MPAKKKLLDKIEIAGIVFDIIIDPELEDWGNINCDTCQITISEETAEDAEIFRNVILHEALHGVFFLSGHTHSTFKSDPDLEEGIVRVVENLFFPILKNIK